MILTYYLQICFCVFRPPRLKNIDRSSGFSMEVTVNNVTVTITDYKPKVMKDKKDSSSASNSAVGSPSSTPQSSTTPLLPGSAMTSPALLGNNQSMSANDNVNNNVLTATTPPNMAALPTDSMHIDNADAPPGGNNSNYQQAAGGKQVSQVSTDVEMKDNFNRD